MAFFWKFVCSVVAFLFVIWCGYNLYLDPCEMAKKLLAGLGTAVAGAAGLLAVTVQRKRESEEHSMSTLMHMYVSFKGLGILGRRYRKKLEQDSNNIQAVQEETLLEMIRDNEDSLYGTDFKFKDIKSREDYVREHPLTRYHHFQPYIQKMMTGETNVITHDPPIIFAVTSGTSGKSNIIPMIQKQTSNFFMHGISVAYDAMQTAYPGTTRLQKDLKFFYTPRWRKSNTGILIGPNSSSPQTSKSMLKLYSTPEPGFDIVNEPEALYVHLLFGLKERSLGMLEANFAALIYTGFLNLEAQWEQLVQDIETGQVNPDLQIEPDVRKKLNSILKPDPARAKELREEFQKGFDGIAKRIWPELNLILTVDTGSFELYGNLLKECYCRDIPFYSPLYGATEGLIGLNVDPLADERHYTLVPRAMFFEFIPIEHSDEAQPETLFLDQVKEGSVYELVITNVSGMFRYRFGDVVKVAGFHNQCPKVEFLYRQGQFLNLRGEKTSERTFFLSLLKTVAQWKGVRLLDYCCAESVLENLHPSQTDVQVDTSPHYLVFVELDGEEDSKKLTEKQATLMDEVLQKEFFVYESFRKKKSIGPMKVHVVQNGTFQELRKFTLSSTDATSNQYKVPRVLKRPEAVKFLLDRCLE